MKDYPVHESQKEKLELLANEENISVEDIVEKAIDEYYRNHYGADRLDLLQEIKQMNEKQLAYLQSIAIQSHSKENYESIKRVNEEINDFFNS